MPRYLVIALFLFCSASQAFTFKGLQHYENWQWEEKTFPEDFRKAALAIVDEVKALGWTHVNGINLDDERDKDGNVIEGLTTKINNTLVVLGDRGLIGVIGGRSTCEYWNHRGDKHIRCNYHARMSVPKSMLPLLAVHEYTGVSVLDRKKEIQLKKNPDLAGRPSYLIPYQEDHYQTTTMLFRIIHEKLTPARYQFLAAAYNAKIVSASGEMFREWDMAKATIVGGGGDWRELYLKMQAVVLAPKYWQDQNLGAKKISYNDFVKEIANTKMHLDNYAQPFQYKEFNDQDLEIYLRLPTIQAIFLVLTNPEKYKAHHKLASEQLENLIKVFHEVSAMSAQYRRTAPKIQPKRKKVN